MHQPHVAEKTDQQNFLAYLKQATLPQHEALERNPYSIALLNPDIILDQYLDVLKRFYGFILPVEEHIYPLLAGELGHVDKFKRGHLLQNDLRILGLSETEIDLLPQMSNLPLATNTAEAFGIVYVLEGSKLGGQFISRHISQSLGILPEQGLGFFIGHGREAGLYWNEFRQAMATFAVANSQQQKVVNAAANTFDAFKNWLELNDGN